MKRFLLLLLMAGSAAFASRNWKVAGQQWWENVEYLASDDLQGRDVGSKGYDQAAFYVADRFQRAGLLPAGQEFRPAGLQDFFQPVPLEEIALNASQSSLTLVGKNGTERIAVPDEAELGYSADSAASITARLVFAGYGLKIPEANHDDLKGLSIRGAVVVFLTGGPEAINGNLRSHYASTGERWKSLREAGAIGMIAIPNPKSMEIPWARQAAAWGKPRMSLADKSLDSTRGLKFSASWNPAKADDLLKGSGHTMAEILRAAEAQVSLPRFPIPSRIAARLAIATRPVQSKNIVGLRRGDDPKLRDEYVVISAHLDHLGIGKPINGDAIYNGAMDDASGVASLIEIAKMIGRSKPSSRRSILFLAVTGEEKGELGSQYFAAHPSVKGKIVADLNMDMFLPLFPLKWLEVQGLNESTLGNDVRTVAANAGVSVQADKEPNHNRFIRSDQYSFVKKGIPALAFKFGYIPGRPEEKIFKAWYTNRYHGVKDDLDQPVDKAAAAQFNDILKNLALRVAEAENAPAWKPDSFFRRFVTSSN